MNDNLNIDYSKLDPAIREKLDFFAKLFNTDLKMVIDYFVEMGLKLLLQSEKELKENFKIYLDRLPKIDDLP